MQDGNFAGAAMLELVKVSRQFGTTHALDGIDLSIRAGEILCLLGQSGCGKSSLLRVIAGVDRPDAGTIALSGQQVSGPGRFVEPEDRKIGFMFQDYALFPHLSVAENVAFGLEHLPRGDRPVRVAEVLGQIGIAHLAERYPHMLSGGEQQRVALARALAPRPLILLMDEPFSNLDQGLRARLREETIATLRALHTTAIIVTHDPQEALSMGDRVVLMRDGRIEQSGTGYEIYDRPASLYAAEFLGPGNRVPGICRAGRLETVLGSFRAPHLADGTPAVALVRPRVVSLAPLGDGVQGQVARRTFLGEVEEVCLRINGLAEPVRLRTTERLPQQPGEPVWVRVDPAGVPVFVDPAGRPPSQS